MKVRIEKLDHFGRGITFIDGKICFVEHALPNEIVELEIIKETKKYILGKAIDYLETSPDREIEKCKYFNICGGCNLEHYNYLKENEFKQAKVQELINKFAKIDIKVNDIIYDEEKNYRNKLTLHGKDKKLGLYKKETNELIEISNCNLVDKRINDIITILQELAKESNIEEVIIRISNDSKKLMIKIKGEVYNIEKLKNIDIDVLIVNDKVYTNSNQIITEIGSKKYYVSVDSLFQVNKTLTTKLYNEVKKIVEEVKPNKVLDLYCGTGTIGIYVAEHTNEVIGVDYSSSNINDANKNKELNNSNNITFINDKVENVIDSFESNIDLVIVDPPRAGLDPKTIEHLKRINPTTIIYVSCDPSTLARDLKDLSTDYNIKYIQPFNMFPRTYHVENVVKLEKKRYVYE